MKYIDDVLRIFRTIRMEKRKVRAIGVIFCISILLISGVSTAIVTQEKEKPEERYQKSNEILEINTERDITFFPDISNDKNSSFIGNTGFSPWYYYIGDIINSANGNLYIALKDISIKGRGFNLEVVRSYNSYNQNHSSGYGYGWTFNYHMYVIDYLDYVIWVDGDGSYHNFTYLGGGVYSAPAGIFERLTKNVDKTFTIRSKDGMVYDFNTIGQIVTVSDKNDNSLTFTYDGAKLLQVKDDSEMYLNFSYNAKHLICMVEDPAGRKILYEYDVFKNLKRVTDAKGNSTRYLYRCCHRLSCLIDRANTSILFSYDDAGYRVHDIRNAVYDSQEQVFYNPFVVFLLAFDDVNYSTYYVTSNNYAWLVKYNSEGNPLEVIDPRNGTKKYTWDDNLITSYTDENGNTDTYEYDSYGNVKNHFNAFSYKTLHDWKTIDAIDSYLSVVENISKISYEPGTQTTLLNDDVDPPSSNWLPTPMWMPWVGIYHSPVTSWSCGEATMFYGDGWNEMLDYRYLNLSGYTDVELSFWHKGDFDGDPSVGYMPDGGNVKISTDGGNNWTIVTPEGGYDGKLAFGNGNPLEVERAFGYTFNWKQEKIDLSSYVGMANNVSIRFNMGTDMYPSMHKGWYIDDIIVMGYIANERKITTQFFYDENGNLEEIKDALGNSSYYDYDAFGNVISETDFRANTTVYTYDTHGNMISVTDPTQNTSRYTYDTIGRMINFTDANGYSTLYTYDENNNIIKITDATGNSTKYVYNANDAKISEIDALGRWTNLTQNVVGEVEQEVDPSGETTYYKYDHDGRFYESTDSKGNTRSAERDPMGRITSTTDAFGYTEWYGYDAKGNVVYYMDKNNAITHYEYDKLNRLMRIIDAYNSEYKYKYDELGNVIELNDENDNSIYYKYDDLNRVIKMEGPGCCGSGTKLFTYDENGNRIKFCDANGYTTTYIYDALNRQTGVLDAEGNIAEFMYDGVGNTIGIKDKKENTKMYYYDGLNRIYQAIDALGNITTINYDAVGNIKTITNARDDSSTFEYDDLNRMLSFTDTLGNTTNYTYYLDNLIETITDPNENTISYSYDAMNRLETIVDSLGGTIQYYYDPMDNVVKVVDANLNETHYYYDALNRLTTVGNPIIGNYEYYTYDNKQNIKTATNAKGGTTVYTHDGADRVIGIQSPNSYTKTYLYDPVGNLINRTDFNGDTTLYAYDKINQLTNISYPNGYDTIDYDPNGNLLNITNHGIRLNDTTSITYDALDRRTAVVVDYGDFNKTISYTYDELGLRKTMTDPDGGITDYEYDKINRLIKITDPSDNDTTFIYDNASRRIQKNFANGAYTTYAYDPVDQLTNITTWNSSNSILKINNYTYDSVGNRINMVDETNQLTTYKYDAIYRLIDVTYPTGTLVQYSYDTAGNRLQETINGVSTSYFYDFENRLTSDSTFTYSYDNNGNLIQKTDGINTHQYNYDYDNNIIQYTAPDTSTTDYYYTTYGFRIAKITPSNTIYYVNDGCSNLMELDTNGLTQARYTHGLGVDDPISINHSNVVGYYHRDVLGSILLITDKDETILNQYSYDAFGNINTATEGITNTYKFTGREFDIESGLYYYRERYYDPVIGRMLSKDWAPLSSSLNFYPYVDNNPVTYIDPLGMKPEYTVEGRPKLNKLVDPNNPPFPMVLTEGKKTTKAWFINYGGELKEIPGPYGGESWLKVTNTEDDRTQVTPDPDKLISASGPQKALYYKEKLLSSLLSEGDQILRGVITQWFEQNTHNPKVIQMVMRVLRGIIGRECFLDVAADVVILFIEAAGEDVQGYLQGILEEGVEQGLRDFVGSESGLNKVMDALKDLKEWNDDPSLKLLKALRDQLPSCGSSTVTPDGSTPTTPSGKRPRHTGPITPGPGDSSGTPPSPAPEPDPEDPKPSGGKSTGTQTSGGTGSSQGGIATNPYDPLEPPGPGEQGPGIPTYLGPPWFPPWRRYNITENGGGGGGMPPGKGGYILIDEPPEYCAYRIVYFSHDGIDDTNDNQKALYNSIKWTANHLQDQTTTVLIMPSKGGYDDWSDWQTFAAGHSDLVITRWSDQTSERTTVTYSGLKTRNCDVLIDSDHALSTQQGGFYTSAEIQAIQKYLEDEHGYIATFGTLGDQSGQSAQTTDLLAILGLEKTGGDPDKYTNSNPYILNDPLHPIFHEISSGWNPGDVTGNVDIGVCPRCGERHEGSKLAQLDSSTESHHAIISAYQLWYAPQSTDGLLGPTGECISVPQTVYFGNRVVDDIGNNHDALYNAIKWAAEHNSSTETRVCIMPGWGGYDGWSLWQTFDGKYQDITITRWSDQQYGRTTVTTHAISAEDADVLIESNHSSNTFQGGFYNTGELQALEWYINTRGHGLIVTHGSLGEHANQVEQKEKLLEILELNDIGSINTYGNINMWTIDQPYHPIIHGISTWDPGAVTGEVDVDTAVKIAHLYSTTGNHHTLISANEGYGKGACVCDCYVPDIDYILITDQPNGTEIADQVIDIGFNITGYASAFNDSSGYVSQISVSWTVEDIKSNGTTAPLMGYSSKFETGTDYGTAIWIADDGYGNLDNVSFIIDGPPEISNVTDYPDPQETGGWVNITCSVIDDVQLANVTVNITHPDLSTENLTMTDITGSSTYYYNATYTDLGTYSYFIWANDTSDKENMSISYTFEIIEQTNNPPNQPDNPDPFNGETNVQITKTLSWTGGDPDPGDTVTYDVYLDTTSPPTTKVSDNQTGTIYDPPSELDYNETYYWMIVAWDNHGEFTSGPEWDFTTEIENSPPNIPSDPDPYDGETDVDIDHDISWTCSDPDGDDLTYDVYFEAGDSTPDVLVSNDQTETTFEPGTLDYDTIYYWQIIAEDEYGATTDGPIWSFTTEDEPPKIPDLDCSGTLSWTGVTPGDIVTGSITVENIGDPGSLLDWEVESYPEWGTWSFNPESGTGLEEDDTVIIDVEVVAPDEQEETFTGEVVLVNSEDPSDYCIIPVSLVTPVSQQVGIHPLFQRILERFPNAYTIIRNIYFYMLTDV